MATLFSVDVPRKSMFSTHSNNNNSSQSNRVSSLHTNNLTEFDQCAMFSYRFCPHNLFEENSVSCELIRASLCLT